MENQMNLSTRMAVILVLAAPGAVGAQSPLPANVGDNANIIPIYQSSDPPAADDYLRGNLLGQRCNEASIGISSINPDHMMVFCNDYRATFNWDDSLVPSGKTTLVASAWNGVKTFFAWLTGRPGPEPEVQKIIASAEAGIGGGVTYDGVTWQGFMVPGGPNDNTPASLAHPGKQLGLQGYSDPFAVSMHDGRVGVAYIGFTRDKVSGDHTQSAVFFSRYRDRNASDVLHDWEYEFSSMVDLSQNLKQGQFLDKVAAAQAPNGTLYVTYTRFTGKSGSAAIFLARSVDGGVTWESASIDKDAKYGQAALPVVNPTDASEVGVLWRTFVDSTLLFKSTRKGTKNVDLFAGDPDGPYLPFDQYSQAIDADPSRVAFRTLAFPAADYTPDGSFLVAVFTEWTDLGTGAPGTAGYPMPMVVMKLSTDGGATWSGRHVLNVENGEWGWVPASPERLGFFSPERPVGAQLMPAVSCGVGNQCLVVWKQSFEAALSPGGPENPGSLVTAGLTRRFDVRGALVTFDG
ncbi:MAG: glycoside hydrolase, partial [Acidobacteria bacterium]|nr:glycoside hydrolase [Acidobacteriota bacterium]